MKISVIVPAYNSELYISETLDCLLNQTLKDIQIIVINDGSTDGTAEIIKKYAASNPNILAVYQENSGVSAARNNGIDRAEGKYTIFVDSDDLLSSNALELMYNALKKTNSDLAVCRVERFGTDGNDYNPIVDSLAKETFIDCYDNRLLWNFLVSNKCYRTDILKKSGVRFPPMRYSEDGAFFMQFIHASKPKITGVFDAVFRYRRHAASVTKKVNTELLNDFSKSMDWVYTCAENSFEDCPEKKEEYLQEILFKKYSSLINEFYRLLWNSQGDDALESIGNQINLLNLKMSDETKKKCSAVTKDIGQLIFSKAEICQKPFISVITKNPTKEFIDSLYAQSMPIFEFITAENPNLPEKENVISNLKQAPKGEIAIHFKGNENLDSRLFKVISLLKRSPKFRIFPDFLIKFGAILFLKLKK